MGLGHLQKNFNEYHSFKDYNIKEGVRDTPDLTEFEKTIGLTIAQDRNKIEEFVENYKTANPTWNNPSIRDLNNSRFYTPSTQVEIGDSVPVDTGVELPLAPDNPDAVCLDPMNANNVIIFKGEWYWIFNWDTGAVVLPQTNTLSTYIGTDPTVSPVRAVYRGSHLGTDANGNPQYHQIKIYQENGTFTRYQASNSNSTNLSDGFWHGTEAWHTYIAEGLSHTDGRIKFKADKYATTGGEIDYGGVGQDFEGLPHNLKAVVVDNRDANSHMTVAFKGNKGYIIDVDNKTLVETREYGVNGVPSGSLTAKNFKWTKPLHHFQINLEYCGESSWDTSEFPQAGSVQYWNGDRRSANNNQGTVMTLTGGNWTDGDQYVLTLDKDATTMNIYNHNDPNPIVETGVTWKIEGYEQTIFRGTLELTDTTTTLVVKKNVLGKPDYRSFNPAFDVNPQEQFTQACCEVEKYVINKPYDSITTGDMMLPKLTTHFDI